MTTQTLTPFDAARYFRDHAPIEARRGLRGYVLRLLLDMAKTKGNERGTCFPSVAYLAERIGRSVRHIRRMLRELEQLGEIQRIYRKREDGGQSSNIYQMRGLLSWLSENVRGASDKGKHHKPYGKKYNSLRRSQNGFKGSQTATPCPSHATPAPSSGVDNAEKGLNGVLSDLVRPPAKWRALTAEQVKEAQAACDPVQWNRYRLSAGLDGVSPDDLDAAAAHRWRGDAIVRGVSVA